MIYIVTHHDFAGLIWRLKRGASGRELEFIRPLSYRQLFRAREAPVGHYIFTDFDRLTAYEMQVADTVAQSVKQAAPEMRILNRPAMVLERYALLRKLAAVGLNDFSAYRLDDEELPARFPAFIRCEDDCKAPDTALLGSRDELTAAIASLRAAGVPMKRRIAVEYCAEADADGYFRKYGVFKIGEHIVPQHIHRNSEWYVKRSAREKRSVAFEEEQQRFAEEIPHEKEIRRIFEIAHIEFGRIDYAIVNDRLQTYEINTNPTWPPLAPPDAKTVSPKRRALIRERVLRAFREIDTPITGPSSVRFALPRPRMQKFDPIPMRARLSNLYERLKLFAGI